MRANESGNRGLLAEMPAPDRILYGWSATCRLSPKINTAPTVRDIKVSYLDK